ncbi:MAG TPA: Wzz/FepE/Etk N-terminal domain-containing protein [Acidimicrobiales bacterium]|nr:Wzz/FepE/Etk N-terminal domain-containing protein [Acidimicrobiales bacterium]
MSFDRLGRPLTVPVATPDVDDPALIDSSPFVTVPALVSALRRRWRVWAATSVAGLLTALVFSLVSPPAYTATTTLLLRHPAQGDPSRAIVTASQLLRTRAVAQMTVDTLRLPLDPEEFVAQYTVNVLSDELLSITVSGPTTNEAVRRGEALAEVFLDFRSDEIERDRQVAVETLEARAETLTSELETVNERINKFPPGTGGNDAAVRGLGELLTRRAAVSDELGGLRARIEEITRDANAVVDRSRVVDPATEDERSPVLASLANLAAGLVAGLALGAGWVVVQEVAFPRVRRRAEVAAALEAPVAASIGSLRGPLWIQRRRFRKQQEEAREGDVAKMVSHLRASLSRNGAVDPALAVVSIDSNGPAALAVALMAVDLTNEGKSVLLADLSSDSALASLFGVSADKISTFPHDGRSALTLAFPLNGSYDPLDDEKRELGGERPNEHDVVLALATLHADVGADYVRDWATRAVAVVTSGRSTVTALRSTSQMLRTAGIGIASVVLVAADPHDDTLGMAPTPLPFFPELPALGAVTTDEPIESEGGNRPPSSPSSPAAQHFLVEAEGARPTGADEAERQAREELRRNLRQLAEEYQRFKERAVAQQVELVRNLDEQRQYRDDLQAEVERLEAEWTAAAEDGDAQRREQARLAEARSQAAEEVDRLQAEVERLQGAARRLEIEQAQRQRGLDDERQASSDRLAKEMERLEKDEGERKRVLAAEIHARNRVLEEIKRLEIRQTQLRQDVASGSEARDELAAEVERLDRRRAEAVEAQQALLEARARVEADIRRLSEEHEQLVETTHAYRERAQQVLGEKGEARDQLEAEVQHLQEEHQRVVQWLELQWSQAERAIAHHVRTKESLEAEVGRLRKEVAELGQTSGSSIGESDGSNGNAGASSLWKE